MTGLMDNRNKTDEEMEELYAARGAEVHARKVRAVQVTQITKSYWHCPACQCAAFEVLQNDTRDKEQAIVKCVRCGHESEVMDLPVANKYGPAEFEIVRYD